ADVYPPVGPKGTSEEIIGRWLKRNPAKRDTIVLATKCRGRMDDSGNSEGLSRRWIIRACEMSLRRLQTDCIDLYQAHQWDPATPIEETLGAFDILVRSGKVRYIGVSNFTGLPTVPRSPRRCLAPAPRISSETTSWPPRSRSATNRACALTRRAHPPRLTTPTGCSPKARPNGASSPGSGSQSDQNLAFGTQVVVPVVETR